MFLLFAALYFWKIVFSGEYSMLCSRTWGTQFYPWYQFAAYEIQYNHTLPLWNPFSYAGKNCLGEPGGAVFYPWNWLIYLAPLHWMISADWVQFWILLSFVLGAWGMYRFARHVGLTRIGSVVAGLTFMFGGYMARAASRDISVFQGLLWLPPAFLFFSKALHQSSVRQQFKFSLLAGAFCGVGLLASVQAGVCIVLSLGVWVLLYVVRPNLAAGRKTALVLLLLVALGALVAASVELVPAQQNSRAAYRSAAQDGVRELPAAEYKVDPRSLFYLLFPVEDSRGGSDIYFGVLPLFLAIYGFYRSGQRHITRFAFVALAALLYCFSKFSVFHGPLAAAFPLLRMTRESGEMLATFHFGLAMLAGAGAEKLALEFSPPDRRALRRVCRWAGVLAAAAGILLIALTLFHVAGNGSTAPVLAGQFPWLYFSWLMMLAAFAVLVWRLTQVRAPRIFAPVVLIALLADLSAFNTTGILPRSGADGKTNYYPRAVYRPQPLLQFVWTLKEEGRWDDRDSVFPPNFNLVHRVRATQGQGPTIPAYYLDFYSEGERALDLLNVRYQFKLDAQGAPAVTKRSSFVPRFQLTRNLEILSEGSFAKWLKRAGYRPDTVALSPYEREKLPDEVTVLSRQKTLVQGEVRVLWENNRRIELEVRNDVPAFLIASEQYDAGWYAYVDKVETPVVECNGILRGIWLPAGEHRVSFRYLPVGFLQGFSFTALYGLALIAAVYLFRKKPAGNSE